MKHQFAALALLCVLAVSPLPAQSHLTFPVRIDTVLIFGNDKTRDEVILREIPFDFPDTLDMEDLQLIQNRLTNLFLFNRVALSISPAGNHNFLIIEVTETLYMYPVPLIFINERDWDKLSYGFQIVHYNFRGMHELVNVGGWLGYNPSFFLNYRNPWLGKNARLILGVNLFGKFVRNKFFAFKERHLGGRLILGKRLNLTTSIEATFSLRRIRFPEGKLREIGLTPADVSVSDSPTDLVPKLKLTFKIDRRDLFEYPRKGYYVRWTVSRAGFSSDQPNFWRLDFDHRLYVKVSQRISLAGRNFTRLNFGHLPLYDRIFIGLEERIRGYFNRRFPALPTDPGQHLMMHNYEVRISLLPIKYLTWKNAPQSLKAFFQQLKYGLSLGLFMDSGIVWDRANPFALNRHYTGYGLGLHVHLPYIYLLRIERAWNDQGQGEWIVEAGVTF